MCGRWIAVGIVAVGLSGCEQVEQVQDRFRDLTPHEAYQASLTAAGLGETALGRDWLTAGRRAFDTALPVMLPFEEEGFITPEEPGAMSYRITIGRGQRLTADVELIGEEDTRVFVDFFRVASADQDPARPIYSSDSVPGQIVHEPWREGEYILRLQPELLRGGRYRVSLRLDAQLAFPVEGHGMPAIQSFFGADRDGGRRSHHGVDIFARRGTPVLATSAGVVGRVDVTGLGGKVVWLRDGVRNANIYYAHLDSQYVSRGDRVEIGDTLGFVGNTGNARTTPPHLHFGIYRRGEGPVDPAPFLRPISRGLPAMTAELDRLGEWRRLSAASVSLTVAPDSRSEAIRELVPRTALRVLAGSGSFYRVRLPDGEVGYVPARQTELADEPMESQIVASAASVLSGPRSNAPTMSRLASGTEVPVLGRFGDYLYVRSPDGRIGWLAETDAEQQRP
jgi:murein DD-endopeptidase MepM/ murein hydrolase activator NlpD